MDCGGTHATRTLSHVQHASADELRGHSFLSRRAFAAGGLWFTARPNLSPHRVYSYVHPHLHPYLWFGGRHGPPASQQRLRPSPSPFHSSSSLHSISLSPPSPSPFHPSAHPPLHSISLSSSIPPSHACVRCD
eukprot:GHVU01072796.1.p2 GENE.GHVU01072796.1~~GHVU01072796.1.p2  ORF type:complete len:133 (-),score=6.51 GHVU01072796.1:434-832(-)